MMAVAYFQNNIYTLLHLQSHRHHAAVQCEQPELPQLGLPRHLRGDQGDL